MRRQPDRMEQGRRQGRGYDAGFGGRAGRGYDVDHRGNARRGYGRQEYGGRPRYDQDLGRYGTPFPGAVGYPGARWGWGPIGWAGWGPGLEFWPYASVPGYGFDEPPPTPRRSPQESPTYGAGGDRAVRRWARRYGYDLGYSIRPRTRGR